MPRSMRRTFNEQELFILLKVVLSEVIGFDLFLSQRALGVKVDTSKREDAAILDCIEGTQFLIRVRERF